MFKAELVWLIGGLSGRKLSGEGKGGKTSMVIYVEGKPENKGVQGITKHRRMLKVWHIL